MPRLFAARACTERLRSDAWNYPWVAPTGSDRLRAVPCLCSLWLCSPKLAEELPQKMLLRSNTWMRKQHGRNGEAACCVTITGVNTEGYILPTRFCINYKFKNNNWRCTLGWMVTAAHVWQGWTFTVLLSFIRKWKRDRMNPMTVRDTNSSTVGSEHWLFGHMILMKNFRASLLHPGRPKPVWLYFNTISWPLGM